MALFPRFASSLSGFKLVTDLENKIRLAKKIAESGIASRREAERLICDGKVTVDNEVVLTPVFFVTDANEIIVNGRKISEKSEQVKIWKFYKPRGVITSRRDPQNRSTVFDFFKNIDERLLYVGRLDYNSEGILLFTNNGKIARALELPSSAIPRTYRVKIFGKLQQSAIDKMRNGVTIEGIHYGKIEIFQKKAISPKSASSWLQLTLREGKNREIRKIMEHFGCIVNRLIRVSYGPFSLENMTPGKVEKIPDIEVKSFLKILIKNN